jgi:hypothetical protein
MLCLISIEIVLRGVAQLGSALLWGSRGRGFKSRRSDRKKPAYKAGFGVLRDKSWIGTAWYSDSFLNSLMRFLAPIWYVF